MAEFNFEGSIENIGKGQLEFINKVIVEQDIKIKKITFEPVGKPGDNFAANVKRIVIEGEDRRLKLITKIAPQIEMARMLLKTTEICMNEHIMYTEFLPKIEQLQIEAGVPKKDRLRYAKCYGSSTEYLQEVLILEDLTLSEFEMLDKFVSLTDTCVRSVLRNFAILHSLSFVLKDREPDTFDSFENKLSDFLVLLATMEGAKQYVDQFRNNILSVFEAEDDLRNKFEDKTEDMYAQMTINSDYDKHSVILQADPWTNNFLFRFKDGQLLESIMLDYQQSKKGNPVNDVMNLIFNCTDYETRSKHYSDWIDYYHTELDKSLSYFNLSAKSVYPRNEMDADLKRYAKFVLVQSCIACIMAMRTGDEALEMVDAMQNSTDYSEFADSVKTDTMQNESRNLIKQKMINIHRSFEDFGLFND
ncbi:unnamed protein product [Chrysodeixis includens]|uniref:CHK kinase-like domain-containing protein n=1 Tax=Chrysodeixis includens TaxID=689277 RepID=A0A9P0BVT1_CHRIL|nr:unnamed protein product [Chrysodeixis includens]